MAGSIARRMACRMAKDIWVNKYPILIIAVYLAVTSAAFGEVCPMKLLTGLPCPGCGLTRGCMALFALRLRESVMFHPAAGLWAAAILYGLIKRYAAGGRVSMAPFAVTAAITMGVYGWRMATQFPGEGPLACFEENLLRYLMDLAKNC